MLCYITYVSVFYESETLFMFSETWKLEYRSKDNNFEMYVYITQVS